MLYNEYLRIRQSQGVNIAHELTIMKELDQIMARHGKPVERITRDWIMEKRLQKISCKR